MTSNNPLIEVQAVAWGGSRNHLRRRNRQQFQNQNFDFSINDASSTSQQAQEQTNDQQAEPPIVYLLPLGSRGPRLPWLKHHARASHNAINTTNVTDTSNTTIATNETEIYAASATSTASSSSSTVSRSTAATSAGDSSGSNSSGGNNIVWQYVGGLSLGLGCWLFFLILPKGLRKAYCRSERRKYTRRYTVTDWRDTPSDFSHHPTLNMNNARNLPPHIERAMGEDETLTTEEGEDDDDDEFGPNPTPYSSKYLYGKQQRNNNNDQTALHAKPSRDYSVQDSIIMATEERRKAKQNVYNFEEQELTARQQQQQSQYDQILSNRSRDEQEDDDDSSINYHHSENQPRSSMEPFGIAANDAAIASHVTPDKPQQQSSSRFSILQRQAPPRLDLQAQQQHQQIPPQTIEHPSPAHPQIRHVPEDRIWRESLRRLGHRGVRLTAHGVQCDPKRIWLKYNHEDGQTLQWQTEFPRQVQNQAGSQSIVLMRGALHRIPLANILYIDVGKKTSALQKTSAIVPPSACFSLLTQQGSLDLQTNSKLERDAVVSSLCYLLDQVHEGGDWRRLYHDSSSSTTTSPSEIGSSAISSELLMAPSNAEI